MKIVLNCDVKNSEKNIRYFIHTIVGDAEEKQSADTPYFVSIDLLSKIDTRSKT